MGNLFYYETPIGEIGIAETNDKITHLFFKHEELEELNEKNQELVETPILAEAARQLKEYFDGKRHKFNLPLAPEGTDFMMRVWKALLTIPYGETRSYKEVAMMTGNAKACRAVGMANNRNPISIIIPCHRVIGTNGDLVGYGSGLDKKTYLLKLERKESKHHSNTEL